MGLGLELMAAAAESALLGTPQQVTGRDWEQDRGSQRDHGRHWGTSSVHCPQQAVSPGLFQAFCSMQNDRIH